MSQFGFTEVGMRFQTKVVHVGQKPESKTGAIVPPLYQTSTYAQEAPNKHQGFDYTRADNPNFQNLEMAIAALEGGKHAVVYSSGLGAAMALLMQLHSGDYVLAVDDVYGGTYRLLQHLKDRFQLDVSYVANNDVHAWQKAIRSNTKYIWLETPTNPLLKLVDLKTICAIGKKKKIRTIVDNTFATPCLQQPLALGADVVLHSTTKYIGGHSDVVGGALVMNESELAKELWRARMVYGLNPSPFDVWLTHRGLKTISVRVERQVKNAAALALFLEKQKKIRKVYYPGLSSHPDHHLAKKQMCGGGGMISIVLDADAQKLQSALGKMKIFTLAESLGAVESLVCHPATMTHASIPAKIREARGIDDTLVRFSIGIEDQEDLLEALQHFLKTI